MLVPKMFRLHSKNNYTVYIAPEDIKSKWIIINSMHLDMNTLTTYWDWHTLFYKFYK